MSAIKAKFNCDSVLKNSYCEMVSMSPVISGSEENNSFSKSTPSGKLELSISNENIYGYFIPGKQYYLTIEESIQA